MGEKNEHNLEPHKLNIVCHLAVTGHLHDASCEYSFGVRRDP
jgi:hypothetical protein